MIDQLHEIKARALEELGQIKEIANLDAWRVRYLGKRGAVTQALRGLASLAPSDRPSVGQVANELKALLETELATTRAKLLQEARRRESEGERLDVTLPGRPTPLGQQHVMTTVIQEIVDALVPLGFQIVEGPEVEWDYYNFEALNIPRDHPARDMWDTFYLEGSGSHGDMLLRTHTSPDQIRVMERTQPPVRVIVPGKCYRYESVDATHEWMFYQVEGLAVDQSLTMADLKGTVTALVRALFGSERRVRFRVDYFPFVEPGVEVAMDCHNCQGAGCRLCKQTGWIEIMGAGMVHPRVLAGVGYDPALYTGFAFGMGPERIAMLKYGIDDIRLFYANDVRFLWQFR